MDFHFSRETQKVKAPLIGDGAKTRYTSGQQSIEKKEE
jgi:hypothetical protein